MFLIDGPYVSVYLKKTLENFGIPVVKTPFAEESLKGHSINYVSKSHAVSEYQRDPNLMFYTNSENALDWILQNLPESQLSRSVMTVKDKIQFRRILAEEHPDYYYTGCRLADLHHLTPASIPFPVILKPSVGFFSLGVQRIEDEKQWVERVARLGETSRSYEGIYPKGVLDNKIFSIEAVIPGDEFAVDCYFDDSKQVAVLNMMKHLFASGDDVNDRVYITSQAIMNQYLGPVEAYLNRLGRLFDLRNFQAHIELRIHGENMAAIEINPLRFGGWCSTADLAQYAWGMNLYTAVWNKHKPKWEKLSGLDPDHVYALIVLNNSTGESGKDISHFDYEALLESVSEPLELRKTDYVKYPLFGFLMCRVPVNDQKELERLLYSDLTEYIRTG